MSQDDIRILLVEDDELLAEVMGRMLADVGELEWVPSAERALELLVDGDYDLVIADIELPGMDGLQLLHMTRARESAPAALIVSGEERFDYAVEAIRAGASDYITKPVAAEELRAKVGAAIAARRSKAERRDPVERVLAIGAHPDDVEIGCGGILLRHVDAGHAVSILTLTGGEKGGEAGVRVAESQRAAELINARLFLLDLDDTSVSEASTTIKAISTIVEKVKPTTIYTHTLRDLHQDHRSTHHASLVAARKVPRVYTYQSPSSTVEFHPSRFISIDGVLDRKLEVLGAYESQAKTRSYLAPDLLRAAGRYWSRFGSSQFAEPLEVVKQGDIEARSFAPTEAVDEAGSESRAHAAD